MFSPDYPLLAVILQYAGPLLGFAWALRAGKSRVLIVLASAAGGIIGGSMYAFRWVEMTARFGDEGTNLPYVLLNAFVGSGLMGAVIGGVALVVHRLLARRTRRT